MKNTESTTRGKGENLESENNVVLMSGKPLHRFIEKEPRILGIVILVFGCAELLMGFVLVGENLQNSGEIYIPFWQGALFLVCGILSTYTGIHPSKKMVTVCLAMYIVSVLGTIVSIAYRIFCLAELSFSRFRHGTYYDHEWTYSAVEQVLSIEVILFISSVCVSVLLIFLSVMARLALKSTHTQVVLQRIMPAQ